MKLKTFFKRLFCLPEKLAVPLALSSFLLVALALHFGAAGPLAYAAYLFSAYGLAVLCVWAVRAAPVALLRLPPVQRLLAQPPVRRFLDDVLYRTRVMLYINLAVNLFYAALELFSAVRYGGAWFGVLAAYYALLAVLRFAVLSSARRRPAGEDLIAEHRRRRLVGAALLSVNLVLSVLTTHIISRGGTYSYPGFLIFAMAAYAFYNLIHAVTGLTRLRKYGSPLMSTAKAISLIAALVTMLSLETAMLDRFGGGDNPLFRNRMIGATAAVICAVILAMSVYMIASSARALKRLRE